MVVEWLKFKVSPQSREIFLQKDGEIWTKALTECAGFLRKEIWLNPHLPDEIVCVIHWESRLQWKAIPQSFLSETESKFAQQMEGEDYQLIEVGEYQVANY